MKWLHALMSRWEVTPVQDSTGWKMDSAFFATRRGALSYAKTVKLYMHDVICLVARRDGTESIVI